MTSFDPRALRNAFGTFMTGVTVVTTHDDEGKPLGFTANSFSSVSLEPALVSICLANSSRNYETFARAKGFGVNVLSETQKDVSNTFARPVENRFATVNWRAGPVGSPIFAGVSAWFDCSTFKTVEAGDHLILIGRVEAFDMSTAPGLGYARGAYVTPAAEAEALSQGTNLIVSALIERDGKVLLVGNEHGRLTLPTTKTGKMGVTSALNDLIDRCGVNAEPGFIYSLYEDAAQQQQHIAFLCQAAEGEPSQGTFAELNESTLMDIADAAMCTMLERYEQERRIGNFGIYLGNQISGKVRPVLS
ncbi:flavin reductase [Shimia sp. MMG029]|uniref:flavin reductase n=1 Tax=Shimia sp. MMG029 TaxID=3021978 RepID=UPI0022FE50E2|nr:flavin reductase [Shimia sp. MMG029]MDA5557732.1 flavin reductase [Shimia sp. MMG029]